MSIFDLAAFDSGNFAPADSNDRLTATTLAFGGLRDLPDAARRPAEPPGADNIDSGLLGAITGNPDRVRSALAALGAGMAQVKSSPFKAQAFANPFGAALEGGNKDEDRQYQLFTNRLAALDRALRARGIAVNPVRAALLRRAALAAQRPGARKAVAAPQAAAPIDPPAAQTAAGLIDDPTKSVADGTREAPHTPQSTEDYDCLATGNCYIHPADGGLRQKA